MIIDEKVLSHFTTTCWMAHVFCPTPHLLLQIEQRKTLYWLAVGLRLVNRLFYFTSMNVLRSIYLPASDPFPHTHSQSSPRSSLASLQRRNLRARPLHRAQGCNIRRRRRPRTPGASAVDLRAADPASAPTSTILRSAASYASLTARLSTASAPSSSGSSFWRMTTARARQSGGPVKPPSQKVTINPLPGLVLTTFGGRSTGSKRTVVEVTRTRDEQLE
ncbi:hypothetical protein B0H13DRAFT_2075071, partial [Mycena leptocephala]